MSSLDEKLEHRQSSTDNIARAKLSQLKKRWGFRSEHVNPAKVTLVFVEVMGEKVECWTRMDGGDNKDPMLQLVGSKPKGEPW